MEKIKVEEIFLRDRISKVITELKELQVTRMETDIEDTLNYDVDLRDIFFSNTRHADINEKIKTKQFELNILLSCSLEGFEFLYEKLLPEFKDKFSEEEYKNLEKLAKDLNDVSDIVINKETGEPC